MIIDELIAYFIGIWKWIHANIVPFFITVIVLGKILHYLIKARDRIRDLWIALQKNIRDIRNNLVEKFRGMIIEIASEAVQGQFRGIERKFKKLSERLSDLEKESSDNDEYWNEHETIHSDLNQKLSTVNLRLASSSKGLADINFQLKPTRGLFSTSFKAPLLDVPSGLFKVCNSCGRSTILGATCQFCLAPLL